MIGLHIVGSLVPVTLIISLLLDQFRGQQRSADESVFTGTVVIGLCLTLIALWWQP